MALRFYVEFLIWREPLFHCLAYKILWSAIVKKQLVILKKKQTQSEKLPVFSEFLSLVFKGISKEQQK